MRSIQTLVAAASIAILGGCQERDGVVRTTAGNLTQSDIDRIVDQCDAPPEMVRIGDGELIIAPHPNIDVMGCVLDALTATGETSLPTIGNERYEMVSEPSKE